MLRLKQSAPPELHCANGIKPVLLILNTSEVMWAYMYDWMDDGWFNSLQKAYCCQQVYYKAVYALSYH